ncbi:hypothetical protein [Streptomyces albidoflavus]|uniref:hypothetical protein n=1 Tax=Streptomyces albidoflavus TaxID=1886 RepID=UPI0033C18EDE
MSEVAPDLSQIPMTPAMESVAVIGSVLQDLKSVPDSMETLALDGAEAAWVEKQRIGDTLALLFRPFTHRMWLRNKMKDRGYDTSAGYHRHRNRDPIEPQQIPAYLNDPELAKIAELAAELRERTERVMEAREKQYPAQHKRLLRTFKKSQDRMAS